MEQYTPPPGSRVCAAMLTAAVVFLGPAVLAQDAATGDQPALSQAASAARTSVQKAKEEAMYGPAAVARSFMWVQKKAEEANAHVGSEARTFRKILAPDPLIAEALHERGIDMKDVVSVTYYDMMSLTSKECVKDQPRMCSLAEVKSYARTKSKICEVTTYNALPNTAPVWPEPIPRSYARCLDIPPQR